MGKKRLKTSATTLIVFNIMIASFLLSSCASQSPAKVDDRSKYSSHRGKMHTVVKGDTLFSISWRYGMDLKKLAEINGIRSPYTIYPGQQLRLDSRSTANRQSQSAVAADIRGASAQGAYGRSKNGTGSGAETSNSKNPQSSPKWQWPSSGKLIAQFQGETGLNKGIDISGKLGEPVLAAASGRVVYAGSGLSGYGKLLIIKHNETFLSAYAHNDEIAVKEGDLVKGGQKVADMGSSGTDRVKLHFEIRSDGSPVDPLRYLPKRQ
jgi:lipoprotein NlpD